jgi:hypothetical protein
MLDVKVVLIFNVNNISDVVSLLSPMDKNNYSVVSIKEIDEGDKNNYSVVDDKINGVAKEVKTC